MSGPDPDPASARQRPDEPNPRPSPGQYHSAQQQPRQLQSAPFQQQLEYLAQPLQHPSPRDAGQYASQQAFDMAAMAGALPQTGQPPMTGHSYGSQDPASGISPPNQYQAQHPMYTQAQRPHFADPNMLARAQQQQLMAAQYGGPSTIQRQQSFPMPGQVQYSPVDPYGYGMSPVHFSPIDPRFAHQHFMVPTGMPADMGIEQPPPRQRGLADDSVAAFARRGSAAEPAPIPNYPRGPPRKPKQSGHALWVGNLPPAAMVTDLKDHFSREATADIESVFLIAKSNCAFVNYRTEAACVAAMNRFHDSRFHGVRLVCRLRRGTTSTSATPNVEQSPDPVPSDSLKQSPVAQGVDEPLSPTIARSQAEQSTDEQTGPSPTTDEKVVEKYFIVKSLTAQDLEASVRNGIWATQSHNEVTLNNAYDQAENVFLIFSANKSGEYFGYARMASAISGETVDLSLGVSANEQASAESAGSPQSIPTPATATAPKGRIIDDSARGTIFWEANHSDDDEVSLEQPLSSMTGSQNWGKQFQIEWVSTNRLPFYRTRGLRNPWNANREVKIARDGTELAPSVGRRLVQMFHGPAPTPASGQQSAPPPAGYQYR